MRETVTHDLKRLAAALSDDEPATRAVLAGAQIAGLAQARYVVRAEPLASMSAETLVDLIAPVFQHYLAEPLTA